MSNIYLYLVKIYKDHLHISFLVKMSLVLKFLCQSVSKKDPFVVNYIILKY